jgi:hypothetical protein
VIVAGPGSANHVIVELTENAVSCRADAEPSRLGPVIDLGPCAVELPPGPIQLTDLPARAINPFLAIVEACWILAGRNDLAPLATVARTMEAFSDDGQTLAGAYGYRLRHAFGSDQIMSAIEALRQQPDTRRVLLSIYSPLDLGSQSLDIPCNTAVMLRVRRHRLDATIINRSNDILFGVPYNIFSFSLLHYYIAGEIGVDVGWQRHFSNSMHLYLKNLELAERVIDGRDCSISMQPPQTHLFMSTLTRNAQEIGMGQFDRIDDPAIRSFMGSMGQYRQERKSGQWAPASDWLGEVGRNWSTRQFARGVATVRDAANPLVDSNR